MVKTLALVILGSGKFIERQLTTACRVGLVLLLLTACTAFPNNSPDSTQQMATLEAIQSSTPPMPTLACQAHTATVTLTASNTTVHVGDTVTVRVTLNNTGCVGLGLVQFSLHSQNPEQKALFHTDGFMPVNVRYVEAGQTEIAQFVLEALKTGEIELTASVGFEVHLGQPGAAYWGGETSVETLTIRVEPST